MISFNLIVAAGIATLAATPFLLIVPYWILYYFFLIVRLCPAPYFEMSGFFMLIRKKYI